MFCLCGWEPREFNFWADEPFPFSERKFPFSDRKFPFEDADISQVVDVLNRRNVGGFLMISGAAILVPGPVDLAVAGAGAAVGGPAGAVAGVIAYNALGFAMLLGGAFLLGALPPMPDPNWEKLRGQMPPMGATPVVWGVPGYLGI